jgi:hypothetical protein
MKLEIGNNQGHVIIDDTSGKIMSVLVRDAVEGKSDFIGTTSYTNNHDGTHTDMRPTPCSNHATQQDEDEEAEMRMRIIMQNGNTGEHYDLDPEE